MKTAPLRLLPAYLANLILMALTAWVVPVLYGFVPDPGENSWMAGIGAAVLFMVLALVCHILSKGRGAGYLLSYFLNGVGSGCAIGTLFADHAVEPMLRLLLTGLIPAAVLGGILCLGYLIPGKKFQRVWSLLFFALSFVLIGVGIYVWVRVEPVVGCFGFFSGLCMMLLPIACSFSAEKPERKFRYLSFSGFGAFILILLVVLILLSEGDILDGLDIGVGGEGKTKGKRVK